MQLTRLDLRQLPGNERNLSWKTGQELLAQVVGKSKDGDGSLLRINGHTYHASSQSTLQQGASLIVKVLSLSPLLELEVLENLRAPQNAASNPSTVVSGQLLEQARRLRQNTLTKLVQLPYQNNTPELQALPGDSMILLNKLKRSLIRPGDLGRLERLKSALDNSGLFLESKLHATSHSDGDSDAQFGNDLKALLLRLVNSLGGGGGLRYQSAANGTEPFGISQYRELYHQPTGLKKQVISHAEEILQKIVSNQYRSVDETDENWQRWVIELPLYSNKHPDSVPLIIHGEREDPKTINAERRWGAEFSLRLDQGSTVKTRINISGTMIRVELSSDSPELAQRLNTNQDRLSQRLANGGLQLSFFKSVSQRPQQAV